MRAPKTEQFEKDLFQRFPELSPISEEIHNAYCILKNAFVKSKIVFLCGNGGSACDSDHIVGELSKGFLLKRELPADLTRSMSRNCGEDLTELCSKLQMGFKAMLLSSQQSLMTAFANDVDPLMCYAQQLFVMGSEGDVMIGISTSGNSVSVCNALKVAGGRGIKRILLTGAKGGFCEKYADCIIRAPSCETYRIQEYHLPVYHTLCAMLENDFYGKE